MKIFLAVIGFLMILGGSGWASPPDASMRPLMRPGLPLGDFVSRAPSLLAVVASQRPRLRDAAVFVPASATGTLDVSGPSQSFSAWRRDFYDRARAEGIQQATLDRAFRGVSPNATVLDRDQNQSEFSRTLWDYLDSAASAARIDNGRAAFAENRPLLAEIERQYEVEAEVVAAIWGLESAYGTFRGSVPIIEAMATLAHEGRRREFFEAELLAALQILQDGDVSPSEMQGSWAGAMGHTQFMPTSFLAHAVDHDNNGRRDIWSDDPTDALASTAQYLAQNGWTFGQPWALEVVLPDGFDFSQSGELIQENAAHWNRLGVRLAGGGRVPDHGPSSILLPAGHSAVALVIYENFHVIETYNPADAYVIGVGHLADRIAGGGAFQGGWPRGDRALSNDERFELQRRLTAAGFSTERVDGIVGPLTIQAVREYQAAEGLVPDGYASEAILRRLRRG